MCGIWEGAAVFSLDAQFLLPPLPPSLPVSLSPFSTPTPFLSQAMTGSWEMMSADFHPSLSAALNLEGKDQYCKNKKKMENSSKVGGFKENKTEGTLKTQTSKRQKQNLKVCCKLYPLPPALVASPRTQQGDCFHSTLKDNKWGGKYMEIERQGGGGSTEPNDQQG